MVITSTVYWKFRQSLVSQATLQPLIMCADSLFICFIAVEIVKTNLNTPIWKAWSSASRAQRPLPTGIVRRQFPSLRGTTWRNKGRSAWNDSRFEHICAFYVEITNIKVIIVIKTDLSGFVVPVHSGLCEQYVKSLGLRPRDLASCFARALVHWDNKPLQNQSLSLKQRIPQDISAHGPPLRIFN